MTDIDYLHSVNDLRIYKKSVLSEEIPEVGTVVTETTYDYYLMDGMGKTVAIFHSKNNDQGLVESWEYYASGAERECRLVPTSAQAPGANTSNTNVKFQKDQVSFYLYDHLGNTRLTYTPTVTTTSNQTQVLNNTFTGTTDAWSATSNATISSVNNQLEVLTSNTTASVSKVIPFAASTDYSLSVDVAIESVGVPADEPNVSLTIISGGNAVAQLTLVNGNNTLSFTSLSQPPTVAFVQINGTLTNYRVQLDNFIVSEVNETTEHTNIINSVVDYFPYGKILREFVNGDHERYLTTQHERDQETDLDYRGARYYDGDVGRFLSLDPHARDYPSLSDYCYVAGNPIKFIDSDGKDIVDGDGNLITVTVSNGKLQYEFGNEYSKRDQKEYIKATKQLFEGLISVDGGAEILETMNSSETKYHVAIDDGLDLYSDEYAELIGETYDIGFLTANYSYMDTKTMIYEDHHNNETQVSYGYSRKPVFGKVSIYINLEGVKKNVKDEKSQTLGSRKFNEGIGVVFSTLFQASQSEAVQKAYAERSETPNEETRSNYLKLIGEILKSF